MSNLAKRKTYNLYSKPEMTLAIFCWLVVSIRTLIQSEAALNKPGELHVAYLEDYWQHYYYLFVVVVIWFLLLIFFTTVLVVSVFLPSSSSNDHIHH